MKIVKFLGGLGNQMFQYALYLALEKQGFTVKADLKDFEHYDLHNGFELENIFGIKLRRVSDFQRHLYLPEDQRWVWRTLRRIMFTKNAYWEENPKFQFHSHIFKDRSPRYYWGYWQHESYPNCVERELRENIVFPELTDEKNRILQSLISDHLNTIAVHVRRGDYIDHPMFGGICNEAYYHNSMAYIMAHTENPLFIFFSNDIDWCREQFGHLDARFVDWNKGKDSYKDMQLMAMCHHIILANSSFSWWAAWLNSNPSKIVVSPKQWKNFPEDEVTGLVSPSFITL